MSFQNGRWKAKTARILEIRLLWVWAVNSWADRLVSSRPARGLNRQEDPTLHLDTPTLQKSCILFIQFQRPGDKATNSRPILPMYTFYETNPRWGCVNKRFNYCLFLFDRTLNTHFMYSGQHDPHCNNVTRACDTVWRCCDSVSQVL